MMLVLSLQYVDRYRIVGHESITQNDEKLFETLKFQVKFKPPQAICMISFQIVVFYLL